MEDLSKGWENFYHIYKGWIERHKNGITPEISAFIKQNMMRAYFTGASDEREILETLSKQTESRVDKSQNCDSMSA